MSRAAFTVAAFGVYLLVLGAVLVLAPNLLLGLFGFPPTSEVWIRVLGIVVIILGVYYVSAAKNEARPFFAVTVGSRFFALAAFAAFAAFGLTQPTLVLFGVVDTLGALWTLRALRADTRPARGARAT